MQENLTEALTTLREKPIIATTYDRIVLMQELYPRFIEEKCQPLRFGMLLREFLSRVEIPLKSYDLFPGRVVDKTLTAEEEENCQRFWSGKNNPYRDTVFGSGHRGYDWENLVKLGLNGIRNSVSKRINHETDESKRNYLLGVDLVLDGVQVFVTRYAEKAIREGMAEVGEALYAIAKRAPETFYEALLLCWTFSFIDTSYVTHNPTLMIGRLDKILYPYYVADIKRGRLTRERAKELILDFYCKHNLNMGRGEHQMGDEKNSTTFNRILNFDAPQYLEIAGTDEQGNPVVNELTELFVECSQPGLKNPIIMLRYFKGLNQSYPALWSAVCQKALKSCSLIIYNDDDTIKSLTNLGVPLSEAREYEHFGCNWCHLGINCYPTLMNPDLRVSCPGVTEEEINEIQKIVVDFPKTRAYAIPGHVYRAVESTLKAESQQSSMDSIYEEIYRSVYKEVSVIARRTIKEMELRNRTPSAVLIYGDCVNRYTLSAAAASSTSAVKYHLAIKGWAGLGTAIDMLTAIDTLVFKEKKLTLAQLHEAVKNNFEDKRILVACKKAPKYGSGDQLATEHSVRLANVLADAIKQCNKDHDAYGVIQLPSFQGDTSHVKCCTLFGPTHDGRREGEVYSQNTNPTYGSCKNGLVGMLGALAKLPFEKFSSGALNVDVNPKDYEGEEGLNIFSQILGEYFNSGGLHAQISAVSVAGLKDAQENPQNHGDLLVRVTGYSGIFVDIGKKLQDDIIRRMEN